MAQKYPVTAEQYRTIDRFMCEIKHELDNQNLNPKVVVRLLRAIANAPKSLIGDENQKEDK